MGLCIMQKRAGDMKILTGSRTVTDVNADAKCIPLMLSIGLISINTYAKITYGTYICLAWNSSNTSAWAGINNATVATNDFTDVKNLAKAQIGQSGLSADLLNKYVTCIAWLEK